MFEYVTYHPYYVQAHMYTIQNTIFYWPRYLRNLTTDGDKWHALPALGYLSFIKAIKFGNARYRHKY